MLSNFIIKDNNKSLQLEYIKDTQQVRTAVPRVDTISFNNTVLYTISNFKGKNQCEIYKNKCEIYKNIYVRS